MIFALGEGVNFINLFKDVGVHELGLVMIGAAILTKVQLLGGAEDGWCAILTVAAFKFCQLEVFFIGDGEANFVFDEVLLVGFEEKVVLERLVLCLWVDHHRVAVFYLGRFWFPHQPQIHFCQEEREDFIRLGSIPVDVHMPSVEYNIF
jgi:hypothetical protein